MGLNKLILKTAGIGLFASYLFCYRNLSGVSCSIILHFVSVWEGFRAAQAIGRT
jgi:hypothetical protein